MEKITFIIPCYNGEKYLAQCLDSIFAIQPGDNFEVEVVCVNDGSTDSSLTIMQLYASKYKNFFVLDLGKNEGWGEARNRGLKQATGNYVWFVDADDTIVSKIAVHIINQAKNDNLDILCFNFNNKNSSGDIVRAYGLFEDSGVLHGPDFCRIILGEKFPQTFGYVWRFIYRRSFLLDNGLFFPIGVCWEDTVIVPKSLIAATRIASTSAFGYNHWEHSDSICGQFKTTYPGKLLYELVFCAGNELWEYGKTVSDSYLKEQIMRTVSREYADKFLIFLCRESRSERYEFYQYYNASKPPKDYIAVFPILSKLALAPYIGHVVSNIASFLYKLSH